LVAALALLGRMDEARTAANAGLVLNPTYTISRARALWTAMTDDPTYLAQLEPISSAAMEIDQLLGDDVTILRGLHKQPLGE
jgi:hypothetical protein